MSSLSEKKRFFETLHSLDDDEVTSHPTAAQRNAASVVGRPPTDIATTSDGWDPGIVASLEWMDAQRPGSPSPARPPTHPQTRLDHGIGSTETLLQSTNLQPPSKLKHSVRKVTGRPVNCHHSDVEISYGVQSDHQISITSRAAPAPGPSESERIDAPAAMPSNAPLARPKGSKRKRERPSNKVPDALRIFANLKFYFFPNNDIHAGRRARIRVSERYGATWVRDWHVAAGITHIIVDHRLNYHDLMVYLKLGEGVPSEVVVVNEAYPSDCIRLQTLLPPNQKQYLIPGSPTPTEAASKTTALPPPCISLHADEILDAKRNNQVGCRSRSSSATHDPGSVPVNHWSRPNSDRVESSKSSSDGAADGKRQADGDTDETDETKRLPTESVPPAQYGDELEKAIEEVSALRDVPLGLEDDDVYGPPQVEPSSDDDSGPPPSRKRSKSSSDKDKFSTFQCMQPNPAPANYSTATATPSTSVSVPSSHPNAQIITLLALQCDYYTRVHDQWRSLAYRKALSTLQKQTTPITTAAQARRLPNVGERLALKIEEIATTSRLRRLESALTDPRDRLLRLFLGVYGVGFAQANRWIDAGCRTLDDVLKCPTINPTDAQRVGIAHYDDFQSRIPRDEVRQLGTIVTETLLALDPGFDVTIGGSYRRGATDSGDVDLLITHPTAGLPHIRAVVLDRLVPLLTARRFLRARLAGGREGAHGAASATKWHGACSLTPAARWRRIDLLLVPPEEMGAALIYFTGNDVFNRSLRLLASRKGMRLNQRGLFEDVMRGKGRERITEGRLVEGRSERAIFERLGVPWREPTERVC